jgi:DNA-3-methyladenine glycosylase I
MLTLEGAQAGLSWITVLKRREGYRKAFDDFDRTRLARWSDGQIEKRMNDVGIIRNRAKIESVVQNARALAVLIKEEGSFEGYLWRYVNGVPQQNRWRSASQLPATTPLSLAMSKDLKRRGFKFVGPTICYAFMQAVGLVDDHLAQCFRASSPT